MNSKGLNKLLRYRIGYLLIFVLTFLLSPVVVALVLPPSACVEADPGSLPFYTEGLNHVDDYPKVYVCPIIRRQPNDFRLESVEVNIRMGQQEGVVACNVATVSPLDGEYAGTGYRYLIHSGQSQNFEFRKIQWTREELPAAKNDVSTFSIICAMSGDVSLRSAIYEE